MLFWLLLVVGFGLWVVGSRSGDGSYRKLPVISCQLSDLLTTSDFSLPWLLNIGNLLSVAMRISVLPVLGESVDWDVDREGICCG